MVMVKKTFVLAILLCVYAFVSLGQKKPLKLEYNSPAKMWEETLPLGNGRLGMTPDGGVHHEKIVLNDITLWSGNHFGSVINIYI